METRVIFRKFKDTKSIIAIFPDLCYPKYATRDNIMSYMFIGQHSECNYDTIMRMTSPAISEEYEFLQAVLEDIGYVLHITTKKEYEKSLIIV